MSVKLVTGLWLVLVATASPQDIGIGQSISIPLSVPAGVPLRLYLTKRVSKRLNAPVEAKLLTPLFVFDREVIPAGTQVLGHVSHLQPVSRWERWRAVLGGDFTPLHVAQIEFTSLVMPDGRRLELHTLESPGLNSLVPLKPPKQRNQNSQVQKRGILGTATQKTKDQIDIQVERIKSLPELVRATDTQERLFDYAMTRLPYHPQAVRNRTRFDAELKAPLDFGSGALQPDALALLGSQPESGSIAQARLLTPVDSMHSKPGQKVEAVLEQPLFSAGHRLVLPEGTIIEGSVAMARKAGWFHRAGRLRFTFQSVNLTPQSVELEAAARKLEALETPQPAARLQFRTKATLRAAESANAPIAVGPEGAVKTTDSKTRFLGTAIALLITHRAADNDAIHTRNGAHGRGSNVTGRTLGGGLGFGMLGAIAAQASRGIGAGLGYYGMAWSVFSTIVARGADVQFDRNTVIDIAFNQRTPEK